MPRPKPLSPEWVVHLFQENYTGNYTNPADTEEDDESVTEYVTQIVYDPPLRASKVLYVTEMPDFFTDAELNTVYHSREEYEESYTKYGCIYKHQKFENADTVQKLLEYSADWVKNNYHGGITSFDVTALDLHLMEEDVDPYMVGDREDVLYPDPDLKREVTQTLTCISAEYDLYNPDKDKYKIGIPDVTLNKVYGESSKSGGGGGGGGNDESETDTVDEQETETQKDKLTQIMEYLSENGWSFNNKTLRDQFGGTESLAIPSERDLDNPYYMSLTGDFARFGEMMTNIGKFNTRVQSPYGNFTGNVDVAGKVDAKTEVKTPVVDIGGQKLNATNVAQLLALLRH